MVVGGYRITSRRGTRVSNWMVGLFRDIGIPSDTS
jgi:hypothetical protein